MHPRHLHVKKVVYACWLVRSGNDYRSGGVFRALTFTTYCSRARGTFHDGEIQSSRNRVAWKQLNKREEQAALIHIHASVTDSVIIQTVGCDVLPTCCKHASCLVEEGSSRCSALPWCTHLHPPSLPPASATGSLAPSTLPQLAQYPEKPSPPATHCRGPPAYTTPRSEVTKGKAPPQRNAVLQSPH